MGGNLAYFADNRRNFRQILIFYACDVSLATNHSILVLIRIRIVI